MDHFGEIWIIKADPGNIDRQRKRFSALIQPFSDQAADMFPDIAVQLHNKSVAFKYRYKLSRRHNALSRHRPAHKHLSAVNRIRVQVIFGLDIQHKLLLCQRCFHRIDNRLFPYNLLTQ